MQLKISLLGGFQVHLGRSSTVTFPTRKGQALVSYLAMHRGQSQSRDKLATLLWGNSGEQQARHSLRQTLVSIRKTLPADFPLTTEGGMLTLDGRVEVDALDFARLASSTEIEQLRRATDLYSGPFLDGLSVDEEGFEDWLFLERERFRQMCVTSLRRIVDHHLESGQNEHAVQSSVKLLSLDSLQEAVHRTLMQLYVRSGRRDAALRQYQICAHLLERELGMEPEAETKELYRSILQQPARNSGPEAVTLEVADRRSILLVDDDAVTRALLHGFLAEGGYEVAEADDGASALLLMARRRFSLILLDLNMPMIDGLKLLEIMTEKGLSTPTICLTAGAGEQQEIKGFKLGAVDFMRKPIQKDVLLMRVRNVLRARDLAPTG